MLARLWRTVIQNILFTIFTAPTFQAVTSIRIGPSVNTCAALDTWFTLAVIDVSITHGTRPSTVTRTFEFDLKYNISWLDCQVGTFAIVANVTEAIIHWFRAHFTYKNFFCVGSRRAGHECIEYQTGTHITACWFRALYLRACCYILEF